MPTLQSPVLRERQVSPTNALSRCALTDCSVITDLHLSMEDAKAPSAPRPPKEPKPKVEKPPRTKKPKPPPPPPTDDLL